MPDAHPDAPNPALQAVAREIAGVNREPDTLDRMVAERVIRVLIDSGHHVSADRGAAWILERTDHLRAELEELDSVYRQTCESLNQWRAERDSAVARAEAAEAELDEALTILGEQAEALVADRAEYLQLVALHERTEQARDALMADVAMVLTVYDEHVAPENRGPWRHRLALAVFDNPVTPRTTDRPGPEALARLVQRERREPTFIPPPGPPIPLRDNPVTPEADKACPRCNGMKRVVSKEGSYYAGAQISVECPACRGTGLAPVTGETEKQ